MLAYYVEIFLTYGLVLPVVSIILIVLYKQVVIYNGLNYYSKQGLRTGYDFVRGRYSSYNKSHPQNKTVSDKEHIKYI